MTALSKNSGDLSVENLYDMKPDPADLRDQQFRLINQNMKYCLQHGNETQQGWLNTFIRDTTTNLPADRESSLKDDKTKAFYNERLAVVYLGRAFDNLTGPIAPINKLSDEQRRRLALYLTAGLSADEGFQFQNAQLMKDAYKACTNIQDYVNDKNGGWGNQLLAKLYAEKDNLINLLNNQAGEGMNRFTNNFTKLKIMGLDDEANVYYKVVLHNQAMRTVGEAKNVDELWQTGINVFVNALKSRDKLIKDLDDQSKTFIQEMQEDLEKALGQMKGNPQLASAMNKLVGAASGKKFWRKLEKLEKTLTTAEAEAAAAELGWAVSPGESLASGFARRMGIRSVAVSVRLLRTIALLGAVALPCYFLFQVDDNDPKAEEKKARYSLQIASGVLQGMSRYLLTTVKMTYAKIRPKLSQPQFEAWTVVDTAGEEISMVEGGVLKNRVDWYNEVFCKSRKDWIENFKSTIKETGRPLMSAEEEISFHQELFKMDKQLQVDMSIDGFWTKDMNALVELETGTFKSFAETKWGKFFTLEQTNRILGGLASLVAVGLAGLAIVDFVDDFNKDAALKKKILDGLNMGITIGFAACAITDTLLVGTVALEGLAAALPVIGAVLAVAGLIVAAIASEDIKKPKSAIDTFVDSTLLPAFGSGGFIKPFNEQTKNWKEGDPLPVLNPYSKTEK